MSEENCSKNNRPPGVVDASKTPYQKINLKNIKVKINLTLIIVYTVASFLRLVTIKVKFYQVLTFKYNVYLSYKS